MVIIYTFILSRNLRLIDISNFFGSRFCSHCFACLWVLLALLGLLTRISSGLYCHYEKYYTMMIILNHYRWCYIFVVDQIVHLILPREQAIS